jgi:hypothetical protein
MRKQAFVPSSLNTATLEDRVVLSGSSTNFYHGVYVLSQNAINRTIHDVQQAFQNYATKGNYQSNGNYNQLNNNLTSQAATMTLHGIPNDVLSNLDPLALIIFIPLCDLIVSPPLSFPFPKTLLTHNR